MKKILFCLSLILTGLFCLVAYGASERKAPIKSPIKGPEGAIYYKITLPKGFDPSKDHCLMVILMHGIFANQSINPMPALARKLADAGIASIRFDFNGHGKSQGRIQDMTIEKELADARAVWNYISSLPYVEGIGLLGHSQGGVVASMTAAAYQGPVLLLHGSRDGTVPMWCSEKFLEAYGNHATLQVVEGENHTITRHRKEVVTSTVAFFKKVFGR